VTEIVFVAGLSGAGRTTAANVFEDLGWYVIDNLPPSLVPQVAELARRGGDDTSRVVFVVGRTAVESDLLAAIHKLGEDGDQATIVFLDAADDVLVRRFDDGRRRHPLSGGVDAGERLAILESIAAEREMLDPVKAEAGILIDTSELNVHQLRSRLTELFSGPRPPDSLTITIESFGYKHGLPIDADIVLDMRFMPNPHWVPELRPHTGLEESVSGYVLGQPVAAEALDRIDGLFDVLLPAYRAEGKAYVTIAVGCTGGRHRSVAMAEEIARRLREAGHDPKVLHRDVHR
jgi:UPF0042 nucleotide-binding protein